MSSSQRRVSPSARRVSPSASLSPASKKANEIRALQERVQRRSLQISSSPPSYLQAVVPAYPEGLYPPTYQRTSPPPRYFSTPSVPSYPTYTSPLSDYQELSLLTPQLIVFKILKTKILESTISQLDYTILRKNIGNLSAEVYNIFRQNQDSFTPLWIDLNVPDFYVIDESKNVYPRYPLKRFNKKAELLLKDEYFPDTPYFDLLKNLPNERPFSCKRKLSLFTTYKIHNCTKEAQILLYKQLTMFGVQEELIQKFIDEWCDFAEKLNKVQVCEYLIRTGNIRNDARSLVI